VRCGLARRYLDARELGAIQALGEDESPRSSSPTLMTMFPLFLVASASAAARIFFARAGGWNILGRHAISNPSTARRLHLYFSLPKMIVGDSSIEVGSSVRSRSRRCATGDEIDRGRLGIEIASGWRTLMKLNEYTTLGRSGLRVSPLCLGTMTFGTEWGWGAEEKPSREVFNRYLDAGGNFIDTADGYTNGHSEEMVGKFVTDRSLRDRVVIATKFTFNCEPGNPNAGGNGRKNIYRAVEASLRRLKTDYIDLYYLHAWDTVTPVEEVVSTLTDLIRAGKIRHYGLSDTPAWYVARAQTLAEKGGKERPITLQLEYSFVERAIEREHIPAAQEFGLGICPWGPLAGGFLSGKYKREGTVGRGDGRLTKDPNPPFARFTERNWGVLDTVLAVASITQKTPAQVALNWVATQPGVTSTILGVTKLAQLEDNLSAVEFTIPADLRKRLDRASAIEAGHPYNFYTPQFRARIGGGTSLRSWAPAQLYPEAEAAPAPAASARASGAEK
jgi:aryl-alcohol dehydrogenase-like predicted oxidoreductase